MVSRERVEGIVRTALVTHHAKYSVMLPEVDEFLDRVGEAYEESARILAAVEAGRLAGTLPTIDLPAGPRKL